MIEPYTAHRLRSDSEVRAIVLGMPACRHDGELFVTD